MWRLRKHVGIAKFRLYRNLVYTYDGPSSVCVTSTLVFQSCTEKLSPLTHWEVAVSREIPITSPVWSKWIQTWSDKLELMIPHWKIKSTNVTIFTYKRLLSWWNYHSLLVGSILLSLTYSVHVLLECMLGDNSD